MSAMHDNSSIYPTLPAREIDPEMWRLCVESHPEGHPFRACWEYVLTHNLSDTEGAAFWTAANLVYEAMTNPTARRESGSEERDRA